MKTLPVSLLSLALGCLALHAAPREIGFQKLTLTGEYWCDGVNAADINGDGHSDIIAGPFWYAGPDFKTRHTFYDPVPQVLEKNPTNSMFTFPYDFNGDGKVDILVLGRVLFHEAFWYENPGAAEATKPDARWKKHFVSNRVFGEAPLFEDVDGDGKPEIVSISGQTANDKIKQWGWYTPDWSAPTKPWRFVAVTEKADFNHYYHGEGIGDINGDGRNDLVLNEGWWEQPPKGSPAGTLWKKHPFTFSSDRGGAQILVTDVNGDGRNDIVTAMNAHGWGVSWFEQTRDASGAIGFTEHKLMGTREEEAKYGVAFSQPHALTLADLDGDGLPDVVTGKRRWAHGPTGDVEPMATPVNYAFLLRRDQSAPGGARFLPKLIDDASGLGTQVVATDVNGDKVPDVLTASKLGTFVFITKRQ
ncbi:FG-GAP repeat domain-containing protein [Horticoccus sp. 23ND18S-11]|uniref:FG-GAP repeat domain-containing protein n=1 Tax=Horticoccus sp. 23ND18S-11 TaxID=3391832 RepID=UPI0039C8F446